jgi:hypothetical protein
MVVINNSETSAVGQDFKGFIKKYWSRKDKMFGGTSYVRNGKRHVLMKRMKPIINIV